ncbi:MAG: sugar ABC transporter permease [Lachnospiraceae bacterium]
MTKAVAKPNIMLQKKKYNIVGYLFIFPALLFFCIYILYPILFVLWGSVFSWTNLRNMEFVGFNNFAAIIKDRNIIKIIRNSIVWILITIPIQAGIGFFLAYLIEERLKKGKGFFRTVFFLPVATSVSVVAIIWGKMYLPYNGLFQTMLSSMGMNVTVNVLGDPKASIYGIIFTNVWEWTGWSMIMYVAGISQIPEELKEAAKIDGAGRWKEIKHIFLPALAPTHKSLLMLGIIGSLQTFALVYTMTNGGPNYASEMPGTYLFKMGFTNQQMGYASALSVVFLLFALALTMVQIKFLGSGDFMKRGEE